MADETQMVHPDILYPLSMFRRARKIPSLEYDTIDGERVPEPYRNLLVHQGDMTSRLEQFHADRIQVRKLTSSSDGQSYFREVVLYTVTKSSPVEYGGIEVILSNLPEEIRKEVLEAKSPLGGILNAYRLSYSSSPLAYLTVSADEAIKAALSLGEEPMTLYGRSNRITDHAGQELARIVEILPPAEVVKS